MKRKEILSVIVLATALCFTGCGAKEQEATLEVSASESVNEEENMTIETPVFQDDVAEHIVEEPALTEEEIYWMDVSKEFEDSKYDLRTVLLEPALKDYCSNYFSLGVGINGSTLENQTLNIPEYMIVAKKHFNSVTMTNLMKSCYILNQTGSKDSVLNGDGSPVLDFSTIDPTLEWCMDNGMKMRGHTLVWHAQAPDWFFREGYSDDGAYVDKETMLFRMESYIQKMLTHVQDNYPGVIYCWDVVNEAVDPDKGDMDSFFKCRTENDGAINPWYETIGEDYVEMAFTYARKYADPDVKLFYNDFNTFMDAKRASIIKLCEYLKEKDLIDGIGMQGYLGINYPGMNKLEYAIKEFAKLGLEIQITELSISVDEETEEQFEKQAKEYGRVFATIKSLDDASGGPANITNVTFFGLIDHYREGDTTNTRLFDKNYQPKPAYEKVRDTFKNFY